MQGRHGLGCDALAAAEAADHRQPVGLVENLVGRHPALVAVHDPEGPVEPVQHVLVDVPAVARLPGEGRGDQAGPVVARVDVDQPEGQQAQDLQAVARGHHVDEVVVARDLGLEAARALLHDELEPHPARPGLGEQLAHALLGLVVGLVRVARVDPELVPGVAHDHADRLGADRARLRRRRGAPARGGEAGQQGRREHGEQGERGSY